MFDPDFDGEGCELLSGEWGQKNENDVLLTRLKDSSRKHQQRLGTERKTNSTDRGLPRGNERKMCGLTLCSFSAP